MRTSKSSRRLKSQYHASNGIRKPIGGLCILPLLGICWAAVAGEEAVDAGLVIANLKACSAAVRSGVIEYDVLLTDFADRLSEKEKQERISEEVETFKSAYAQNFGTPPDDARVTEALEQAKVNTENSSQRETTFHRAGRFAFDGKMYNSILVETLQAETEQGRPVTRTDRVTFDGRAAMSLTTYEGSDRLQPNGEIAATPILQGQITRRDPRSFGRLVGLKDADFSHLTLVGEEDLDIGHCIKIANTAGHATYWICPGLGNLVVRELRYFKDSQQANEIIEIGEATQVAGLHFPRKGSYKAYAPDGRPVWESVFSFEKVSLNVPVPPEEFSIVFPAGIRVVDQREHPPLEYTAEDR